MRLWDLAPPLHTEQELQQKKPIYWLHPPQSEQMEFGSIGAGPLLPISLTAALHPVTCPSQTHGAFLCFHVFARVLSAPSPPIHLNLTQIQKSSLPCCLP